MGLVKGKRGKEDWTGYELDVPEASDIWPDIAEGELPVVMGHQLTMQNWKALQGFVLTGKYTEGARRAGVSKPAIYLWHNQPWWQAMMRDYIKRSRERTLIDTARNYERAIGTLESVMDATDKADKTAQARVNAARTVMELGEEPILNRRPNVQVQTNILHNHGTLNIERLRGKSSDQWLDIWATGKVPEDVIDHK